MIVYFKFYDGLPEVGSFKHPKSALLIKKSLQVGITSSKAVKQHAYMLLYTTWQSRT